MREVIGPSRCDQTAIAVISVLCRSVGDDLAAIAAGLTRNILLGNVISAKIRITC